MRSEYLITTEGDPLRKLIADVYTQKGRDSITDVPHAEFQRELNASLAGHVAEIQDYIKQVRGIVDEVRDIVDVQNKRMARSVRVLKRGILSIPNLRLV